MSELKKRRETKFFLACILLFFPAEIFSQNTPNEFTILFYNVENLFDLKDDPKTLDDEFTPSGDRRWTYKRFQKKLLDISKVILNASGWKPPQLVALCEVENSYVLEKLLSETPLQAHPYKIIHKESPDRRGIDVALLYNENEFYPTDYQYIPLKDRQDSVLQTREILYVSGILAETDTVHLFANHWPSRYSGLLESHENRTLAARVLRKKAEELQEKFLNPKIIIVGDFNDQPTDESILLHLGAIQIPKNGETDAQQLYNLSFPWMNEELGTLKYQSQWSVFDQIIVTGSLLNTDGQLFTRPEWANTAKLPFLFEKDERYGGLKINRTYSGFRYNGGFSDHLPVLLKIQLNRKS
jgi:endonuclease/exonuclease/phosphatase family metal-dependent hydrolase